MAADDVPSLLQRAALAHEHLIQENKNLRKENEWLSRLLDDKLTGGRNKNNVTCWPYVSIIPCSPMLRSVSHKSRDSKQSGASHLSEHKPLLDDEPTEDQDDQDSNELYSEDTCCFSVQHMHTPRGPHPSIFTSHIAQNMHSALTPPPSAFAPLEACTGIADDQVGDAVYVQDKHCANVVNASSLVASDAVKHHSGHTPAGTSNRGKREWGAETQAAQFVSGTMPEGRGSTHITNIHAFANDSEEQWYIGEWVDLTGSFFNGSVIHVGKDSWGPWTVKRGKHKTTKDVVYSIAVDQDAHAISLSTLGADGKITVYRAKPGPEESGTLIVWLESDRSLVWTLSKHAEAPRPHRIGKIDSSALTQALAKPDNIATASSIVDQKKFKLGMCVIILCSMLSLGTEIEFTLPGRSASPMVITMLFIVNLFTLTAFILEIVVSIRAHGWNHEIQWQWHACQTFVTACDAISLVICSASNHRYLLLRCVVFLRSWRLLRVAEFFKSWKSWQVAWQLVDGLMSSAATMISMSALLFLILYISACVGLQVITRSDFLQANHQSIIELHFDDLFGFMFSLLQFVTDEGFNDDYFSLIRARPYLLFYFASIYLTVSISLMNLVTGVIVDGAMEVANNRREAQRNLEVMNICKEAPEFRKVFAIIEKKDAEVLCRAEFENLDHRKLPLSFQACLGEFHIESLSEAFDILDVDCSDEVTEEQFVTGMLCLRVASLLQEPRQLVAIHKLTYNSQKKINIVMKNLFEVHAQQCQCSMAVYELQKICASLEGEPAPKLPTKPFSDEPAPRRLATPV